MISTKMTYNIAGIDFDATVYSNSVIKNNSDLPLYDEYDAFGCDYVTVIYTDDINYVDEILSRITFDNECIVPVVQMVEQLYAIYCDLDSVCDEHNISRIIGTGCIVFASMFDDIDAITCVEAYQYCKSNNIVTLNDIHNEIERVSEEEMYDIENMLDSYTRIIEYNDGKHPVDHILEQLVPIKQKFENHGVNFNEC